MKTYIISYDLMNPGQRYEELLKKIKEYKIWVRLGGSAYVIKTTKTHLQVRDDLKSVLDFNDKLFVSIVKAPAAWTGMSDVVSNWLRDNLEQ